MAMSMTECDRTDCSAPSRQGQGTV
jgi:hypothetical protein